MSPFVKAAAYALQDQPVVNAVIMDNEIVYRDYIDISVAVATPKVTNDNAVFIYCIMNCNSKSFNKISILKILILFKKLLFYGATFIYVGWV